MSKQLFKENPTRLCSSKEYPQTVGSFKDFLLEGDSIIDDIISSFPESKPKKRVERIVDSPKVTTYSPRVIPGKHSQPFREYIRNDKQLLGELQDKLNTSKITLDNVLKLFANYNLAIADNMKLEFKISEIAKYREYDRTREYDPKYYDKLKRDIKQHGIKEPGYLEVHRLKSGDVSVLLGEGNHRIQIGKELNIPKMGLKFGYL